MNEFGKIDTGSKVLDFILNFMCFGFIFSLIWTVIKLIIVFITGGTEAYKIKKRNEALKNVVRTFYKFKIQKQELTEKEINKLIKDLKTSDVKYYVTVQDLEKCKFENWNVNTALSWDGETFDLVPSLAECNVII